MLLAWCAGVGVPTTVARADDCLTAPNSPAPEGSHWYYQTDRAKSASAGSCLRRTSRRNNRPRRLHQKRRRLRAPPHSKSLRLHRSALRCQQAPLTGPLHRPALSQLAGRPAWASECQRRLHPRMIVLPHQIHPRRRADAGSIARIGRHSASAGTCVRRASRRNAPMRRHHQQWHPKRQVHSKMRPHRSTLRC